ncbi:hypothetical protein LCGC14_1574410 [marine sediment metagenome]|uniref:DUF3168 domain-containing protein n=1 Tax=marine sediment metagenome TaxID=412755 RepID=A0A0F9IIP7_9ZZZZ
MTDPLDMLFESMRTYLSAATGVWEGRVYVDRAPAKKVRPYIVFFMASDTDLNEIVGVDPMIVLSVKCVAETRQAAFLGSAQITALLNDKGQQQVAAGSGPIGDDDWEISTISEDRGIYIPDRLGETGTVYHRGHQYEFRIGAKA